MHISNCPNSKRFYACNYCSIVKHKMKKCSSCKITRYCSIDCQEQHWRIHKHECSELKYNEFIVIDIDGEEVD